MAFVIDTQGSQGFNTNDINEINDDVEESDDDFLFIPLKPEQRRPSYVEDNEYLDMDESYPTFNNINTVTKDSSKSKMQRMTTDPGLAKSTTLQPGLEKLERVPSYLESKRMKQLKRKAEQAKSKGFKWFNLPAPEVTEEMKNDIEALQMRSALDPKHFYKKNDMKHMPKYFQVGKVVDSPADFYSSRIPNKERKRTFVDDLLADAEFQRQTKRRYKEIISERQKSTLQYVRQKRRQQKKKGLKKSNRNVVVGRHHPSLYAALEELLKEQSDTEVMLQQLQLGQRVKKVTSGKQEQLERRLYAIVSQYDEYVQNDDTITYLRSVGYNL